MQCCLYWFESASGSIQLSPMMHDFTLQNDCNFVCSIKTNRVKIVQIFQGNISLAKSSSYIKVIAEGYRNNDE